MITNIPVEQVELHETERYSTPSFKRYSLYTITGIGLITFGLYLRFETSFKYIAVTSYSIGWTIIALILYIKSKGHQILKHSIFSCCMISLLWIIIETRQQTENVKHWNSNLPLIPFSVLFTYFVYILITKSFDKIMVVLSASFFLLTSEYVVLPLQRQYDIKDGIGLPLFFLGILCLNR